MQGEQEPALVRGLRSLVARDTGLHSQAAGLSPGQMHLRGTGKGLSGKENDTILSVGFPHVFMDETLKLFQTFSRTQFADSKSVRT